jgi:hypothetical protein
VPPRHPWSSTRAGPSCRTAPPAGPDRWASPLGFDTTTLAGGPYENQGSQTYNFPLYEAARGTTPQFWDNHVEELVSAGVDFVAVDTRGYILGSAVPNQGGDPRALAGLVDAINRGGYATS